MANATLGVADENISNPAALGARQPGRDERVGCVELRVHPHRTTGQEDRDGRNALSLVAAKQGQAGIIVKVEIGTIALELGIGFLAEYHDRDVGTIRVVARRGIGRRPPRTRHRLGDTGEDRLAAGEVGIVITLALPVDRPAA